ncbi:protein FAR1-RELATED SEQUENCE 5-like [Olea europaea var. sylvestris]|uniref:protein FAR1-RELATED SEQUENCE 5-like n=1 Tax=Olea europaea var. sylvestris TaxID=158386 RepID=UPI000C1D28E9|nr:protein FAR1-RELATED SEQUENCE 5-like [Olea europaea var. sylvestris]
MENVNDDCSVESGNENVTENMNKVDNKMLEEDDPIVSEVGMIFSSEKEMWEFYKIYVYSVGFPVRKRNSKKGNDGALGFVTFTCSREGKNRSSKSYTHGSWRISTAILEHNYKTSPSKSRLYRCNRELSTHVKRKLKVNDMAGIPLHKSYNSVVVEAVGYEKITCIEKDCRNYIENNNRYRQTYKEFGDVVTFDATYLTNKYDMPFAPFVGVDHHRQSILLGCGLVSNEDIDTFVWLFSTWLKSMPEFEVGWSVILDAYELHDNDWLSGLYKNRSRWVPCFLNTSSWVGMSTTQRNESINAFFDGYVYLKTSLK